MEDANPPSFVVTLAEDGSAAVTVTYAFGLSDDARQAAFETFIDLLETLLAEGFYLDEGIYLKAVRETGRLAETD